MFTYSILTISDAAARGQRLDASGQTIQNTLTEQAGFLLQCREVVPDDMALITGCLKRWAPHLDLILTTGGTGLGPRDVTPEATLQAIERPTPGLAETLRAETRHKTPMASLSRGVAGLRGRCLIINFPGNPQAVHEYLEVLLPILSHALETARGPVTHHPVGEAQATQGHGHPAP